MNIGLQRSGFTLIELMVAIVVVSILTAVAFPSYRIYALRANRTIAKSALVDVVSRQEAFFVDRKRYTSSLTDLGLNVYLSRDGSTSATQGSNSIYQLSLAALSSATCPASGSPAAGGYTVIAAPLGAQANDTSCDKLCLTSTGIRLASAANATAANCWSR